MNRRKSVLIVVGTRPEAIKLAPVILALAQIDDISITVCTSGQHEDMVEPALAIFGITPDKELSLGHPARGSLTKLYSELCLKLGDCIEELKPDYVIVHGDTLTTTAASMSAFFFTAFPSPTLKQDCVPSVLGNHGQKNSIAGLFRSPRRYTSVLHRLANRICCKRAFPRNLFKSLATQ